MHRLFLLLMTLGCMLAPATGISGGDQLSNAPKVDFSTLPETAVVLPENPDGKDHPVQARMILDQTNVRPGHPFRLGIHLTQQPGWHTYWKSPGDIGLPTHIEWSLPDGFNASPYAYPTPIRFEEQDIVSYGYNDQVFFFSDISVPENTAPGTIIVSASVNWLVCKTTCIPGSAELSFPIEVVDGTQAASPSPWVPLFTHYAAQHPTPPIDIQEVAFEGGLSTSAIQPNSPFKVIFRVTPTGSAALSPPASDSVQHFYPIVGFDWMVNSISTESIDGGGWFVIIEAESFEPEPLPKDDRVGGLFQIDLGDRSLHTEFTIALPWQASSTTAENTPSPLWAEYTAIQSGTAASHGSADSEDHPNTLGSVLLNLIFAFFGGLLLNIMPCVLPVLALKLYGLIEQTNTSQEDQRAAGMSYTAGILVSFWILAGAVYALQSLFQLNVGWGFQFQYPPYVAALATIVFAFGLSLFGVFEISAMGVQSASEKGSKEGKLGYFFTGIFATLVATPCSAPFLGVAIAVALTAPPVILFLIFTAVGLGLAFPFLLVAFVPALYRLLPKPGAWMETFKQLMGFTLIATALWLVDVLGAQVGMDGAIQFMAFLLFLSIGCWIYGHFGGLGASRRRQLSAGLVGLLVTSIAGVKLLDLEMAEASSCEEEEYRTDLSFEDELPWQAFSEAAIQELKGNSIFIDFTADWCLTCKVNEKAIIETRPVMEAMETYGIVPLKADYTRRGPVITEWLRRYKRAGVPFYLVLPANPDAPPIALPEVITGDMLIQAFKTASES